ncbi:MAG: protein tyrosine phosphatase, partial [Desulfocapsa sp.]|nr:protein tyrosine phosphatase [Desulfocapsa sp.]
ATYVSHVINSNLSREKRNVVLERALKIAELEEYQCPLFDEGKCLINDKRPLHCRKIAGDKQIKELGAMADKLSRDIFFALTDSFLSDDELHFSMVDTVSGRFVMQYFQATRDQREA